MHYKQKRRVGGRVTPTFIRNIRKGYLMPNGESKPGQGMKAFVLLQVLRRVQDGKYLSGMSLARRHGFDLETMFRDYRLLVKECRSGHQDFFAGLERFCTKYSTPIRLRMVDATQ